MIEEIVQVAKTRKDSEDRLNTYRKHQNHSQPFFSRKSL